MAAPQQSGQSDNSAAILWMASALFVAIGLIWFSFKKQIVYFFITVKLHELDFIRFISDHFHLGGTQFDPLRAVIATAQTMPDKVGFQDMVAIGTAVGHWLRMPFAGLLLILGVAVYVGNTVRIYSRIYTMKDLANLEKVNWPQISPTLGLDLIKTDIDAGPWAMAMTPMQYCKRHRLLDEVRPMRQEGMSRKDWDRVEVVLKRGEANKLFAMQLGPMWKGVDQLPDYMKGLFAVFAARIMADTKEANQLLKQFSESPNGKSLNMTGVDALIKKHINAKHVQEIIQSHAYVTTVMASMLVGAREDGVQASADFLWLKPVDRRLWYTLNTVGRQTPFIEVAGIFAHWVAEVEAGRKLVIPMVEEATNAVEIALKEVIYKPEESKT